jgi:hypothetical protein
MTWFPLPALGAKPPPAFADMVSCNDWLAQQPLANAPLMQNELAQQLECLNGWNIHARERFKVLETLRKVIFAIETESLKRYEYRPLPLSPVEQKTLDTSCHLWRELATGYLHCLRACLDGDTSLTEHSPKICHRTLTALRLEQLARYRGGAAVPGNWWRLLHATRAASEQLGVCETAVSDRLFAETRESSPTAQYAMAILLHLCRPHELSRSQFSAVKRWLSRWRAQVEIHSAAGAARDSRCLLIDLSSDAPAHLGGSTPAMPRWLAIDSILGKFKNRIKSLREGQTPEDLKLGPGLPAEACIALMQFLHGALQSPPPPLSGNSADKCDVGVCSTVERIYLLLGGKPLGEEAPTAQSNRRVHEQIAIFGRAATAEQTERAAVRVPLEQWKMAGPAAGDGGLNLLRSAGSEGERLSTRSLIAIHDPANPTSSLAIVRSLATLEDSTLHALVRQLPEVPTALVATGREKMTNRTIRYPVVFLPASGLVGKPASLFVPAGVMAKLTRFDVPDLPRGLVIGAPLDRGANYERLRCE